MILKVVMDVRGMMWWIGFGWVVERATRLVRGQMV